MHRLRFYVVLGCLLITLLPTPSDAQIDLNRIISTVNSTYIYEDDFQARVEALRWITIDGLRRYYEATGDIDLVEQQVFFLDNDPLSVGTKVLDDMELEILLDAEASKRGITITEDMITAEFREFLVEVGILTDTSTDEETTAAIDAYFEAGHTQAEISPSDITAIFYLEALRRHLQQAVTDDMIADGTLLDTRITASVRHILIAIPTDLYPNTFTEAVCTSETWQPFADEANRILGLLNAGESFEELAQAYSGDFATANDGGLLPPASDPDYQYVTPFAEVVRNGEVGPYLGPVCSQFGFHIVQILSREFVPRSADELEDLRDSEYRAWELDLLIHSDIQRARGWEEEVPNVPVAAVLLMDILGENK